MILTELELLGEIISHTYLEYVADFLEGMLWNQNCKKSAGINWKWVIYQYLLYSWNSVFYQYDTCISELKRAKSFPNMSFDSMAFHLLQFVKFVTALFLYLAFSSSEFFFRSVLHQFGWNKIFNWKPHVTTCNITKAWFAMQLRQTVNSF